MQAQITILENKLGDLNGAIEQDGNKAQLAKNVDLEKEEKIKDFKYHIADLEAKIAKETSAITDAVKGASEAASGP